MTNGPHDAELRRQHERRVASRRITSLVRSVREVAEDVERAQPDWALAAEAASPDDRARWLEGLNEARRVFDASVDELMRLADGDLSACRRCDQCGAFLLGGRSDRRYCSETCRTRAFRGGIARPRRRSPG